MFSMNISAEFTIDKGHNFRILALSGPKFTSAFSKSLGGANAGDPDEVFRSFIVCSCNQATGHQPLSPIDLDRDGNFGPMDQNSREALACLFNLWEILLLAQEGGK